MILTNKSLSRRTALRGLGTAIALPFLDAMTPAWGAPTKAPTRLGFVYHPVGMIMDKWTPATEGTGFEFTVIAAVVIGGASLLGGRGSIVGSILGSILLVVIDNGLNLINASVYIYDVVKGVILIAAVIVDVALMRRAIG